jgi:hypothetical protein
VSANWSSESTLVRREFKPVNSSCLTDRKLKRCGGIESSRGRAFNDDGGDFAVIDEAERIAGVSLRAHQQDLRHFGVLIEAQCGDDAEFSGTITTTKGVLDVM